MRRGERPDLHHSYRVDENDGCVTFTEENRERDEGECWEKGDVCGRDSTEKRKFRKAKSGLLALRWSRAFELIVATVSRASSESSEGEESWDAQKNIEPLQAARILRDIRN
jgi:hypothetical protein